MTVVMADPDGEIIAVRYWYQVPRKGDAVRLDDGRTLGVVAVIWNDDFVSVVLR